MKDGLWGCAARSCFEVEDIGDVDAVLAEAQAEIASLRSDLRLRLPHEDAPRSAPGLEIEEFAPFVASFPNGKFPKAPEKACRPFHC